MNIDIKPIHYHETISEDEITHQVVLGEQKLAYQVCLNDTFWNCEDELTAKALLIQELKVIRKQLENELNERLSFKEARDEISYLYKQR